MIDLSNLDRLLGSKESAMRFLSMIAEEAPKAMQKMQDFSRDQDWASCSIEAHSFKSQMRYLNEEHAAELAFQLESLCESGNLGERELSQTQILLRKLQQETDRIVKEAFVLLGK